MISSRSPFYPLSSQFTETQLVIPKGNHSKFQFMMKAENNVTWTLSTKWIVVRQIIVAPSIDFEIDGTAIKYKADDGKKLIVVDLLDSVALKSSPSTSHDDPTKGKLNATTTIVVEINDDLADAYLERALFGASTRGFDISGNESELEFCHCKSDIKAREMRRNKARLRLFDPKQKDSVVIIFNVSFL